jgi:hypothetical protein
VAEATPRPLGVVRPPPKANLFIYFSTWEVAEPPPWAKGVASATPNCRLGVASQGPLGVDRPPQGPNPFYLKNLFWPLGVAGPPPRA